MTSFRDILTASGEELVKIFHVHEKDSNSMENRGKIEKITKNLGLNPAQLILAVGFNPHSTDLTEIPFILGYKSIEEMKETIYL